MNLEPLTFVETASSCGPKGIVPVDDVKWKMVSPTPINKQKYSLIRDFTISELDPNSY